MAVFNLRSDADGKCVFNWNVIGACVAIKFLFHKIFNRFSTCAGAKKRALVFIFSNTSHIIAAIKSELQEDDELGGNSSTQGAFALARCCL